MTTLLVARHGETDWNREGRWQGWADPALNDTGRAQATRLAGELRAVPFDAVYSSDLRRAFETAEILAEPHRVPVIAEFGLREIDVGSWSGLTRQEIQERFPDGSRPDGETHEEHGARVRAAVTRIALKHPGGRVLLVGHGGTIRSIHDVISELPYHPVPNCHVLEVHFRDDRLVAAEVR
jgi:probable phosphoglycerate mutase